MEQFSIKIRLIALILLIVFIGATLSLRGHNYVNVANNNIGLPQSAVIELRSLNP